MGRPNISGLRRSVACCKFGEENALTALGLSEARMGDQGQKDSGQGPRSVGDRTQRLVWTSTAVLVTGMLVVSYLLDSSDPASATPRYGVGLAAFLVFTAASATGGLLGFLFGLPRSRLTDQITAGQDGQVSSAGSPVRPSSHYLSNSNLIKVSDWLTTIIIGLALVNLKDLLPAIRELADVLEEPLGGYPHSAAIGLSIVIGSVVAGFVLGFVWTTIRVRELLEEAERNAHREVVPRLVGKTVGEARSILGATSLRVAIPNSVPEGDRITSQSISAESVVPGGTVIDVESAP